MRLLALFLVALIGYCAGKSVPLLKQDVPLEDEKTWGNVHHPLFGGAVDKADYQYNFEKSSLKTGAPTPKIWKTGYTYEYDYRGVIGTRLDKVSQKATGGIIKARLVVEPVDETTINVALFETKAKMFNEDVIMTSIRELLVEPGTEAEVVDQQYLEKPFQIKIVNGKVESVDISKDEPLWVVNYKRALVAQLQLQFDETSGVFHKTELDYYYADNSVYYTLEGSSTGECQTWYEITPLSPEHIEAEPMLMPVRELCEGRPVYEITKNRNLDRCRILPTFHYNSNDGLRCNLLNGTGCQNKISHTDSTVITGCTSVEGDFIIQNIQATDKLIYKPLSYETEAKHGVTFQTFFLRSAKKSESRISQLPTDVHRYQTLVYSYDEDYKIQGPLMGKPTLYKSNSPMVLEAEIEIVLKEAERLRSEIVADLDSEAYYVDPTTKYVPEKINMFRRALGSLDYDALKAFVAKYWEGKEYSTSNQVMLDTLMLAGTNPSLMIVQEMILDGRVAGEMAVQAVAALVPTIETPTRELLAKLMDFFRSDVVTGHRQLKITTALSLSRLVYQACIHNETSLNMFPKLVMGEFCNASDPIVVSQFVPYLTELLINSTHTGERIAYLTALGNIGHEMILPSVLPFIASCEPSSWYEGEFYIKSGIAFESKKEMREKWLQYKQSFENRTQDDHNDIAECNIVRTKAIFALSRLAVGKRQTILSVLMPIYSNKVEHVEVRLAALSLLFVSEPPKSFWSRVALSTWFEPNEQIAHYIYTTISSLVLNKDPERRELTFHAESVLPLMKPRFFTTLSAIRYNKAGYSEQSRLGYNTESVTFPGFESFLPSHYYQSLYATLGPWFTKIFEASFYSRHAEKFIDRLLRNPKGYDFEAEITHPELVKIREELQIEARATGQPELFIYVNLMDNYQRLFTINPNTVFNVIKKQLLSKGFGSNNGHLEVNYHKYLPLLDTMTRIPSSMGLAYTTVGHHSVFVSLKSEVNGGLNMASLNAKLEGTIKPTAVFMVSSRLMVEAPWSRSYPMTGVDFEITAALPGKFSVEGDFKTTKVQQSYELLGDKLRVAKYAVTPFTTIRKIDDFTPAILLTETKFASKYEKLNQTENVWGDRFVGMNFIYTQQGEPQAFKAPLTYSDDWFGSLLFLTTPSTLRLYESNLYLDNAKSETKAIKTFFSFATKSVEKVDAPATPLHSKNLFSTLYGEALKQDDYVSRFDNEWNTEKFQHVLQSLVNPVGYSIDFTVEFTGKSADQTRRFGSSLAYAADAKIRHGSLMIEKERYTFEDQTEGSVVLCADFDTHFPEYYAFKRQEMIPSDLERKATLKIGFGKSCTDDRKVTVESEWSRFEHPETVEAKLHRDECEKHEKTGRALSDQCLYTKHVASLFNKNVLTINYNEMPAIVRNVTYKASSTLRHWFHSYVTENQVDVHNVDSQIRIESIYNQYVNSFDMHVFKPKSNTFFHGIEIHPVVEFALPRRLSVPRSTVFASPSMCLVGKKSVDTFDELFYNATISECDQVLVKDCSGRHKMAVLAREEENHKIVTVYLNNEKIELFPASQKIKVNDIEFPITEDYIVKNAQQKILAHIRRTIDGFIDIDSQSHMIRVVCDSEEVYVYASPIHRGHLCGMCGSLTGDKQTDLTGPKECSLPRNLLDIAYELKRPAGCKSSKPDNEYQTFQSIQEQCRKEKESKIFGLNDNKPIFPQFQESVHSDLIVRNPSERTIYRNRMVVREDAVCFSTEAVPKCQEGSRPVDVMDRKLAMHCLPKNELATYLSTQFVARPLNELLGMEVAETQVFSVPSYCVPV